MFEKFDRLTKKWVPYHSKYRVLLFALIAHLLISPILLHADLTADGWFIELFFITVIISCVYTIKQNTGNGGLSIVVSLVIIFIDLIAIVFALPSLQMFSKLLLFILFGMIVVTVMKDIILAERITKDTIRGAICGYMLIALVFGSAYEMINYYSPNSFNGVVGTQKVWFDLLYFSYMTITSVGFGDISPVGNTAKVMTIFESIIGVFYLATVVAHLVSGAKHINNTNNNNTTVE